MISIEQRIELLKGGYTPEQIATFENPAPEAPKDPAPAPAAPAAPKDPAPAPAPAPTPAPAPAVDLAQVLASNKLIMENVAKLTAALQANAIATAVQPGIPAQYTGDQAIAEIIAPPRKEVK
jgi:hypothetical protein